MISTDLIRWNHMASTIDAQIREHACILELPSHLTLHLVVFKGLLFVDLRKFDIQSINLDPKSSSKHFIVKRQKEDVPSPPLRKS